MKNANEIKTWKVPAGYKGPLALYWAPGNKLVVTGDRGHSFVDGDGRHWRAVGDIGTVAEAVEIMGSIYYQGTRALKDIASQAMDRSEELLSLTRGNGR